MNNEEKDVYFVAVKVFLKNNGRLLILRDNFGDWDLPGGRMKSDEFQVPLEAVLQRKIREELGVEVDILLSNMPILFMRHERIEEAPGNPKVRIFALGYEGTLVKGDIQLSPRHAEMLWADVDNFEPEKYFTGGWLKGVRDYLSL